MDPYDLTHFTDDAVDAELTTSVGGEKSSTAKVLARIAEYDARKLYLRAGYASMYEYCVSRLGYCEHAARKRIHAARTARAYPLLFPAVADGRIHLTGVLLLAPHLNLDNVDELISAAAHRSAAQIEQMLAARVVRLETLKAPDRALTSPVISPPTLSTLNAPQGAFKVKRLPHRRLRPRSARLLPGRTFGSRSNRVPTRVWSTRGPCSVIACRWRVLPRSSSMP